jgi:3-isopropylmalate/(R)-2-methylmalate dehydratase small subunit
MKPIEGRVWIYGDNINTDVIFPGKYTYTITDPDQMRQHALEDLDPEFHNQVQDGDIIVAGKNWGCGSSREQAVTCLKVAGVGAIVARSFARIYYRNCLNAALPAIVCPDAVEAIQAGDRLKIDLLEGRIHVGDKSFSFDPLPQAIATVFDAGGLVPYTRSELKKRQS